MSKITELIKELCPNGVEHKTLDEVCYRIYAGGTPKTSHEEYYNGDIKWLRSGEINFNEVYDTEIKITELGLNNSSAKIIPANSVVIAMTGATVARTAMIMEDMSMNQSVCALLPGAELNYRFLYQCLTNQYKELKESGQGVLTSLNLDRIKKIIIPIPPLEVQEEIVRILDKFGELEVTLEAELEAELEARKSQYEFWRDSLLNEETSKEYKLKEMVDLYLGLTYTPNYVEEGIKFLSSLNISKGYLDLKNIKYISKNEFENSTSNAKPKKGDVLYVRVGSNLGHPVIYDLEEDVCVFVSVGFARVKNTNILNNKYLKYWMDSDLFMSQVKSKTINSPKANLNASWMKEFNIFIPSLEKQNTIVQILDKFNKSINDISMRLPAEIDLRRKQYEYYRNKLLSFEEKIDESV